jgi:hypothetical protein
MKCVQWFYIAKSKGFVSSDTYEKLDGSGAKMVVTLKLKRRQKTLLRWQKYGKLYNPESVTINVEINVLLMFGGIAI